MENLSGNVEAQDLTVPKTEPDMEPSSSHYGGAISEASDLNRQSLAPSMGGVQASEGLPPGPNTPVEMKLFVGRVPRSVDESILRPCFEEYGQVLEIAIIKDRTTGCHKGSAFVRMASITQADAAIRGMDNIKVFDPSVGALQVRYATGEAEKLGMTLEGANPGQDQAKLFIGSLPRTATEEDIRNIFLGHGTIDEVFVMKDPASGQGRGCAFVKFHLKEEAINAIRCLNSSYTVPGAPRPLEVRFAESKKLMPLQQQQMGMNISRPMGMAGAMNGMPGLMSGMGGASGYSPLVPSAASQPQLQTMAPSNLNPRSAGPWKEYFTEDGKPYYHNEQTGHTQWEKPPEFDKPDMAGPPGANIFIFHVPNEWVQNDLIQAFQPFGKILSARIATDKATNRNKGYAFVSYGNINSAANAVMQMNGYMVGQKRLKVSIKQNEENYVQHLLTPAMGAGAPAGVMRGSIPQMGAAGMMVGHPGHQGAAIVTPGVATGGVGAYPGAGLPGAAGYTNMGGLSASAGQMHQTHRYAPY